MGKKIKHSCKYCKSTIKTEYQISGKLTSVTQSFLFNVISIKKKKNYKMQPMTYNVCNSQVFLMSNVHLYVINLYTFKRQT